MLFPEVGEPGSLGLRGCSVNVQVNGTMIGGDKHINFKELLASINPILDNPSAVANAQIKLWSDNKVTVTWLSKGTSLRSGEARDVLQNFTSLAYKYNLSVSARYVKGRVNLLADSLTRSLDFNP